MFEPRLMVDATSQYIPGISMNLYESVRLDSDLQKVELGRHHGPPVFRFYAPWCKAHCRMCRHEILHNGEIFSTSGQHRWFAVDFNSRDHKVSCSTIFGRLSWWLYHLTIRLAALKGDSEATVHILIKHALILSAIRVSMIDSLL